MVVTKKALPRRTFLRGVGAAVSLPLLDAMLPAMTAQSKTAAAPVPRIGFIYTPNGYLRTYWVPTKSGRDWEVTRSLQALAPYRDHITLVSGLAQRQADTMGDPPGPHSRASGAWLTGVHVKRTEGADVRAGKSADQVAADVLGRETALPSIEIAIEQNEKLIGNCEGGYSCVYQNTVSWRDPTTPMPMETNPRVVFERLFGEGGSAAEEREELGNSRSILDAVNERIAQLLKTLGPSDRQRLDQYLESVRDIESRIKRAEARTDHLALALPERPIDIPGAFEDHVKMMFDLQALAYQGDVTRVMTFQMAREQSPRAYPTLGISGGHHAISHHSGDPEKIEQKAKIDAHHIGLLAYYIEKLRTTPDGDGSLLDHVLVMYGASLGDPNAHDCWDLPNILIGSARGRLKPGRHLAFNMRDYTPMCNMLVSMLGMVGVPIEKFGDNTGRLRELSEL
jgi:hypothetical protein